MKSLKQYKQDFIQKKIYNVFKTQITNLDKRTVKIPCQSNSDRRESYHAQTSNFKFKLLSNHSRHAQA